MGAQARALFLSLFLLFSSFFVLICIFVAFIQSIQWQNLIVFLCLIDVFLPQCECLKFTYESETLSDLKARDQPWKLVYLVPQIDTKTTKTIQSCKPLKHNRPICCDCRVYFNNACCPPPSKFTQHDKIQIQFWRRLALITKLKYPRLLQNHCNS